jgi:putative ABC transport system ATP-binding protein
VSSRKRSQSAVDLSLTLTLSDVPSDPVIVEDLCHDQRAGGEVRRILAGASLRIARGEIVVVAGAPGAGKTTLLSLIGGWREPQAGRVCVLGTELTGATLRARRQVRRRVGFVPQAPALPAGRAASGNPALARALAGEPPLLLADDPTAALDGPARSWAGDLLQRLARERGSAVLIATLDPALLAIADRVLRLEQGVLVGLGEPERTTIVYRQTA